MPRKTPKTRSAVTGTGIVFEPRNFGDPMAEQTDWAPLIPGGTNFRTRWLRKTNSQQIQFLPTLWAILFAALFVLIGVPILSLLTYAQIAAQSMNVSTGTALMFFVSLLFSGGGLFMLYYFTRPIVFDKTEGFFWKWKRPEHQNGSVHEAYAPLAQIHAIQLISESVRSSITDDTDNDSRLERDRYFHSFELNLVLQNGERLNVVDHGSYRGIRDDAHALAEFLGVPVWDACG